MCAIAGFLSKFLDTELKSKTIMIRKSICLSTWRNPKSEALIWVEVWIPISERIEQFIEPDKNLLLVWNY